MDAIQFNPKTKKIELVKKEIPKIIGDNQILVQVHYAGICGTDLHIIDGEFPCKQDGSLVLGHEFSGIVAKIGKNIKHVKIGDKVVTDPNKGCMVCQRCRTGNPNFCKDGGLSTTVGIYIDGGWEQYVLVSDVQIHKVPEGITLEQGICINISFCPSSGDGNSAAVEIASLCEPISCITHAWDKISPVTIGTRILVIGSGIIGNLFVSILHLQGHKNVTVSEPIKERLKMLERLETGYELITPDTLMDRQKKDENYLFDLVIDCSGNAKAIEHAVSLMDFGAKMCIFGVANPTAKMSISPYEMFKKELTIHGVVINPFTFPKALHFLEAMGDRYINFDKLGVKTFSLNQFEAAIQELRKGTIAKATFKIEH